VKQQFLVDIADTIRITVYSQNRPLIPTSATVILYHPDGSVLQASASATVDGTTGEITYSLTATHTDDAKLNYKAVWAYVVSGTTYYQTQLFDVVKSILAIPLIDDDLFNELESLRGTNEQQTGTATSATSSTLVDTAKRKEADNYWKGGRIRTLAGTGPNQERIVSSNTQSSGTISVTPNWTTTPDSTTTYQIERSYYYKIEEAFKEFEDMLYNKGMRHQLILESSQIAVPLKYLTLVKICTDLMDDENDKWDRLRVTYWDRFNDAYKGMALDYDADDTGSIQGDEAQSNRTSFEVGRS
jgi:hypothetical protein